MSFQGKSGLSLIPGGARVGQLQQRAQENKQVRVRQTRTRARLRVRARAGQARGTERKGGEKEGQRREKERKQEDAKQCKRETGGIREKKRERARGRK